MALDYALRPVKVNRMPVLSTVHHGGMFTKSQLNVNKSLLSDSQY